MSHGYGAWAGVVCLEGAHGERLVLCPTCKIKMWVVEMGGAPLSRSLLVHLISLRKTLRWNVSAFWMVRNLSWRYFSLCLEEVRSVQTAAWKQNER